MPKAKRKKTGGATKGSVTLQTNAVKDAVLRVFNELNEDNDDFLYQLAEDDRKTFVALCMKLIPQEQEIEVKHTVDLGAALIEAQARLNAVTIEHDPADEVSVLSVEPGPVTFEVDAPAPSRPFQLDENFDVKLNEYGLPIKGDE